MSFAIQLDQEQSLINAKLMGEITPDLAIEFFQELLHKVQVSGAERIFTDATELELARPIEEFQRVPQKLLELGFPTNLKRAILIENEPDKLKQWEDLLFSRGYQQVKLFEGEQSAMDWLMN